MGEAAAAPITVGVVGLGYVGLPLASSFAENGDRVIGVDVDPSKLEAARGVERIEATSRFERLEVADAILICVPTPLTPNREPDLTQLVSAASAVRDVLRPGQLVVLESTSYPGTTRERLVPILAESGLVVGRDFHVAYSPERVDPGRTDYTMRNTPRVIGGVTAACGDRAEAVYRRVCESIVRVSSPEAAELAKLLENIFRSVNIALVNEMTILADRMGIDIWEVVDAASTKPYGFMRFEPGPGMGGHCLPVDPFYLSWKAREYDFSPEFIELAGKINQAMPYHCVELIERALNDSGKPVRGSRIAVLGVAYKAGVGDVRESPALKIMKRLSEYGAELVYHDRFVPRLEPLGLTSEDLDAALTGADVAVVLTAHPGIDYTTIAGRVPRLVDMRGVTREALRTFATPGR